MTDFDDDELDLDAGDEESEPVDDDELLELDDADA